MSNVDTRSCRGCGDGLQLTFTRLADPPLFNEVCVEQLTGNDLDDEPSVINRVELVIPSLQDAVIANHRSTLAYIYEQAAELLEHFERVHEGCLT